MGPDLNQFLPIGATPLDPDEAEGLIPYLVIRSELNAFEQANILKAVEWSKRSRKIKNDLLTPNTLLLLHKKMFDQTWRWAGKIRLTNKNIGVEPYQIYEELSKICADTIYRINNKTFSLAEIAIRFHHRLALIHPFVNGNGRHARLSADLLMINNELPRLTWGGSNIADDNTIRREYIESLQEADRNNYAGLIEFAQRK